MKLQAALLAILLLAGSSVAKGQETQAEPQPSSPVPGSQKPSTAAQQKPAPVERRAARPTGAVEEPSGPLTPHKGSGADAARSSGDQSVTTFRVPTRLVNVALNVVDRGGTPVGGFEKKDFQIFENGKVQPIAVFEREATSPLSIVLAIDASETVLTSERLERDAAKHFIRAILRPQDELDLIDFSDNVREVVSFTSNPRQAELGLGRLMRGQETALFNAIYLASQRLATTRQEANRRRVLVVISDGGDSGHGERYEDAVEQAQRANAIIYSIIIVPVAADAGRNTGGEHAMIQMSEDTGGKYYYVEDPRDLEPAFQHVSEDLRTQYLLGYYSPDSGDAAFRRIRVMLTDPAAANQYSLRYRTGYYPDQH